jgi:hypothetical protein
MTRGVAPKEPAEPSARRNARARLFERFTRALDRGDYMLAWTLMDHLWPGRYELEAK